MLVLGSQHETLHKTYLYFSKLSLYGFHRYFDFHTKLGITKPVITVCIETEITKPGKYDSYFPKADPYLPEGSAAWAEPLNKIAAARAVYRELIAAPWENSNLIYFGFFNYRVYPF